MKSAVVKRSIELQGKKTSVSVERAFWDSLKEIAARQGRTLSALVHDIDSERQQSNLSSAIRLFVLNQFRPWPDTATPATIAIDDSIGINDKTNSLRHDQRD